MQLTPSQQNALDTKKHISVIAGAGSGKTTVLVERYLKILYEGNVKSPQEIVAITFTEKAAAEMKKRIITELTAQETYESTQQYNSLQRFREEMGSAHISTIHAFCSRILREFPFQAGVPANFSIIQNIDQKLLLQQTITDTLKQIATDTNDRHRPELTRLLQRYGGQQKLVDFFSDLVNQREIIEHLTQHIYDKQSVSDIRENWGKSEHVEIIATIERLMANIDVLEFIRCLNVVLQVAKGKKATETEKLTGRLETLHERHPDSPEIPSLLKKIIDGITTNNSHIRTQSFLPKNVDRTSIADEIRFLEKTATKIKGMPVPKTASKKETDDDKTDSEEETDDDFLIHTTRDLFKLYERILREYQNAKFSQSKLDFSDLQIKTRDLLQNNEDIRQTLVSRHKYYMIDEYQDTNELQYSLVMCLTDELKSANLFIVGDPKQSIYAFRGADVSVFEKTRQKIAQNNGRTISLAENFRSLSTIIAFVNYFFSNLMEAKSENKFEVPYEFLKKARPTQAEGQVELLFGNKGEESIDEPALIARHIKNMKLSGETVSVRENGEEVERSIAYGDVAILIRSRTHLPDIEHALLEAGIPYLTTGGIGFYQRQEIYDIWNYLNFLDNPTKNHASLVGILRGPAFGISDTEIYEISEIPAEEKTNFWEKAHKYPDPSKYLKNAIDTLKKHTETAHRTPVNQLILAIVNETGMIGTLKTGKQGQQRWANYQKLLELARNFDADEDKQTLTDFIDFLNILIDEEPREGQAPMEPSTGAVEIMTIHAAKGKQFPIVILPCLDRRGQTDSEPFIDDTLGIGFSPLNPKKDYEKTAPAIVERMKNRANAKSIAEKKRILYVGATRAEDRLILSGTLSAKGKPLNALEWLHKHLDIDEETQQLNLSVALEVFANNHTKRQDYEFQIPVSRTLASLASGDEISGETTDIELPDPSPPTLQSTEIKATFTVAELANYARCPLRYQLENLLQLPQINAETEPDEEERNKAIRQVMARIRQQSDTEKLDSLINETLKEYPELTGKSTAILRTCVNNFTSTKIRGTFLNASEVYTNQHIQANINGHIIEGRFDRIFKDKIGQYQLIIYDTTEANDSDLYRPQIGLYALLMLRRYPEQPIIIVNIFFNKQGQGTSMQFSTSELLEVQKLWGEKISKLQTEIYEKNFEHCCFCPYADPEGQCIVTEI